MAEEKKTEFEDVVVEEEQKEVFSEAGEEAESSTEAENGTETEDGMDASEDAENVSEDTKTETGKKGFFKKKKDKNQEKIEELEDRVKRQMAEFDNFRKRTEKEKAAMFETGAKSVIEKILPVVDNFERGLQAVPEGCEDPFVEGMQKVYKQLISELENIGVKPIEAVGVQFDPNLHNAVMQASSDELESGTVAQELLKGYTYRDTVVRHSMVSVVE